MVTLVVFAGTSTLPANDRVPGLSAAAHAALTEAEQLRRGGDTAGAEAAVRRLLDHPRSDPFARALAHQILAHAALDQGREGDAAASFEAALSIQALPTEAAQACRRARAQLLLGLGRAQEAERELTAWFAASSSPRAEDHALQANVLAQLGRSRDAATAMGQAVQLRDPAPEDWWAFFAGLQAEAGDQDAALATARRRIELFPTSRGAWEGLAGLYASAGRRAEALVVLELAATQPALSTPADERRLARLRLELGMNFEAAWGLRGALEAAPGDGRERGP